LFVANFFLLFIRATFADVAKKQYLCTVKERERAQTSTSHMENTQPRQEPHHEITTAARSRTMKSQPRQEAAP